jgi:hypothetical protein
MIEICLFTINNFTLLIREISSYSTITGDIYSYTDAYMTRKINLHIILYLWIFGFFPRIPGMQIAPVNSFIDPTGCVVSYNLECQNIKIKVCTCSPIFLKILFGW